MADIRYERNFGGADALALGRDAAPASRYRKFGKRTFDILLAVALLPVIGITVLLLCALVYAHDRSFPMFGHARVGRGGRMFRCWKIRTMVPDAESRLAAYLNLNPAAAAEWDAERKLNDDPRITRIGDIMRRTSLDELPQIWNVLIGEMSFVGPRPVTADELGKYGISRSAYCAMRPGITGLWQVSGRNEVSYAERVALDVDYLRRMSLALDLSIIARTAGVIVRPTGK
jgi:lipopolysaccharide/colanic/teichoic acid biosynthesis glycosyltransferase